MKKANAQSVLAGMLLLGLLTAMAVQLNAAEHPEHPEHPK